MFEETPPQQRPPRNLIITFHLGTTEKRALYHAAKRADRSVSAYIRLAVGAAIARDEGAR